ncbi:MAG: Gfo/Idh/MocA family oxidoreductase [Candidatus Omnitrophica bacterium]|nr:Gfo/Idh/MocA family oxidoreductase [Candidatus Omnitrophota bacterium]
MMTDQLNAVVVGVGSLGRHHARIYANHPKIRLAAVVDIDEKARTEHAQKWNCQAAASLDEIGEPIHLASVVVPTVAHFEIATQLIERGASVLIEKPIAMTVEEGRKIVHLAEDKGVAIQVGHIERFNPAMLALGDYLNKPLFIESHRLGPPTPRVKDVGVVLDLMIHDLDLIMSLVGNEVDFIDAVGVPILTPQEDIANARIRFKSGCTANVTVSRVTPEQQRKIRFFQRDTYISIDLMRPNIQIYRKVHNGGGEISIEQENPALSHEEPLAAEIGSFISSVEKGTTPVVTGRDGVRALDLARQITDQVSALTQKFMAGE